MRFLILLTFSFILIIKVSAQSVEIDSLREELLKAKDISKQLDIQIELAHCFAGLNFDSVKYYAGNVVKLSKKSKDYINLCHGYLKYALGYYLLDENNNTDSTWIYLDSAYNLAVKHNYYHGVTAFYQLRWFIYYYNNDFEKAINDLLVAAKRSEIEKDTVTILYCKYNLSDIYILSGKYEKALNTLLEDTVLLERYRDKEIYFYIQSYIGELYRELGMHEKSFIAFKKVYDKQLLAADTVYKIKILEDIGFAYYQIGKKDSADIFFQHVIDLSKRGDKDSILEFRYIILAKYLMAEKDYDKAEKYLLVSLNYAREKSISDIQLLVLKYLAELYETKHDFGRALDYVHYYMQLKDSIKVEGINYLLDKALSDQELKIKINELSQMKSEMIKRNYIIISYSIMTLLLFFIIWYTLAGILYNFYKTRVEKEQISAIKNLWNYVPPSISSTNQTSLISSLVLVLLTFISCKFLFQGDSHFARILIWSLFSGILFFVIEMFYFQFQQKKNNLSFVKELSQLIAGLPVFIIILIGVASLIGIIELFSVLAVYLAILMLGNLLITNTVNTLLQYRKRFDILSESLLQEFNRKIALRKKEIEISNEEKEMLHYTISVDNAGKTIDIDLSKVVYIVSDNVYQEFIVYDNDKTSKILVRNTLSTIEKQLENYPGFLRCHRSYIVNTRNVVSLDGNSRQQYFILDKVNEKIPVSRSLTFEILNQFESLVSS